MNEIIVPKAKRTIFINDQKFSINMPELTFGLNRILDLDHFYTRIIKDKKQYHVPLPNIQIDGCVCLGKFKSYDLQDCIDHFFNSQFKLNSLLEIFILFDMSGNMIHGSLKCYTDAYDKEKLEIKEKESLSCSLAERQRKVEEVFTQERLQFYFDNPIEKTS